jgi:hypothetical protein
MLKLGAYTLAAIAVIFSLTAYGADPVPEKSDSPPAPAAKDAAPKKDWGNDPIKIIRAAVKPDTMGYLYAVVYNPSDVTINNVYVVVVHFNPDNGQPNGQSDPLLVAKSLEPKQFAKLQLEGLQVYHNSDLKQYRIIVARAELAK